VLRAWSLRLALASPALSIVRVSLARSLAILFSILHAPNTLSLRSVAPQRTRARAIARALECSLVRLHVLSLSLSLVLSLLVRVSLCPRVLPTQPHPSPNSTGPYLLPLLLLTAQSFLTHTHPSIHMVISRSYSPCCVSCRSLLRAVGGLTSPLEHAAGAEQEELLAELEGRQLLDDSFLTGPFGTRENPVVVRSRFDSRIVGCVGM